MQKIILLENKETREDFKKTREDFKKNEKLDSIEMIIGDEECNKKLDEFNKNMAVFDSYDTIIIHKNIYCEDKREDMLKKIVKNCKNKSIVIFTGGDNGTSLRDNVLELTAKKMYENLEMYANQAKENKENILMFEYGKKWEVNILLKILEKINIFIEDREGEEVYFYAFQQKVALIELKKINLDYESIVQFCHKIKIEEIKNIEKKIRNIIQEKIYA